MKRYARMPLVLASLWPLMRAACFPTPPPPAPPRLAAPVFTELRVVAERYEDRIQEFVYLAWTPPDTDSVSIAEYVIIPTLPFDTAIDTLGIFSVENPRLPASRTFTYQRTEGIRRYTTGTAHMQYRIYAVDGLGRDGDTSAQCTVSLALTADLAHPLDTLSETSFEWSVFNLGNWFHTNMVLWADTGSAPLYVGDTSSMFGGNFETRLFGTPVPFALAPGTYTWAARLEIPSPAPGAQSFSITEFYVP